MIQAPGLAGAARKVALASRRSCPLRRRVPGQEEEQDLASQDQVDSETNLLTGHRLILGVRELSTIRSEVLGDVFKRLSSIRPGGKLLISINIQDLGEGALGLAGPTAERRKSQHPASEEIASLSPNQM